MSLRGGTANFEMILSQKSSSGKSYREFDEAIYD